MTTIRCPNPVTPTARWISEWSLYVGLPRRQCNTPWPNPSLDLSFSDLSRCHSLDPGVNTVTEIFSQSDVCRHEVTTPMWLRVPPASYYIFFKTDTSYYFKKTRLLSLAIIFVNTLSCRSASLSRYQAHGCKKVRQQHLAKWLTTNRNGRIGTHSVLQLIFTTKVGAIGNKLFVELSWLPWSSYPCCLSHPCSSVHRRRTHV